MTVLDIVVDMLDTEGYDAVQLREVARRARVSLATIYKTYPTRDDLILAALESWMEQHRYAALLTSSADIGDSLPAALTGVLRTIFEPWEQHPRMLEAYWRARMGPGGQRLVRRGYDVVVPAVREVLARAGAESFERDLDPIMGSLVYALLGRCATGEMKIAEALTTLDRAVFLLSAGYQATRSG